MKIAALAAAATLAVASAATPSIPAAHQARFLQDRAALETELDAWKSSAAGQAALSNGFYVEDPHESTAAHDDQLSRFFLTKLAIEKSQKRNPKAVFSVNSPFTLMTSAEFSAFVKRGSAGNTTSLLTGTRAPAAPALRAAEATKDWSTTKCVAPVKNQGDKCGSCWAFATVSVLESANCIKTGALTKLSEQELVSCDSTDGGCKGGLPSAGLAYVKKNGGVSTATAYPYTSGPTGVNGYCRKYGKSKLKLKVASVATVGTQEAQYLAAISKQPVAVAVTADNDDFKQYSGGVLSSCSSSTLDHAVVAVGYDESSFKIRNSWGPAWGENGYIHLERQDDSTAACGMINDYAVYPVLA